MREKRYHLSCLHDTSQLQSWVAATASLSREQGVCCERTQRGVIGWDFSPFLMILGCWQLMH